LAGIATRPAARGRERGVLWDADMTALDSTLVIVRQGGKAAAIG
jgi:hypothetical protein